MMLIYLLLAPVIFAEYECKDDPVGLLALSNANCQVLLAVVKCDQDMGTLNPEAKGTMGWNMCPKSCDQCPGKGGGWEAMLKDPTYQFMLKNYEECGKAVGCTEEGSGDDDEGSEDDDVEGSEDDDDDKKRGRGKKGKLEACNPAVLVPVMREKITDDVWFQRCLQLVTNIEDPESLSLDECTCFSYFDAKTLEDNNCDLNGDPLAKLGKTCRKCFKDGCWKDKCIPVNHQFDNEGQITCDCVHESDTCFNQEDCVREPKCKDVKPGRVLRGKHKPARMCKTKTADNCSAPCYGNGLEGDDFECVTAKQCGKIRTKAACDEASDVCNSKKKDQEFKCKKKKE